MNNLLKLWVGTRVLKYTLITSLCLYSCSHRSQIEIEPDLTDKVPSQLEQSIEGNSKSNNLNLGYSFPEQKCLNMMEDYEFDLSEYPICFQNKEKNRIFDHLYIKPKIDISNFQSDEYNLDYIMDLDIKDLDLSEWHYGIKFEF